MFCYLNAVSAVIPDFVLVDSSQNLNEQTPSADYLISLEEGATYSLSELETRFGTNEFALLCITDPAPFTSVDNTWSIGSVGLRDNIYQTHLDTTGTNSGKDYNGEGNPPYVLADDSSGDYNPTNFRLGEAWSITCQAFCERGLRDGEVSAPVTRNFTMTA